MVIEDLNLTDIAASDVAFVGDGTDDVLRFHAVCAADLDPIAC